MLSVTQILRGMQVDPDSSVSEFGDTAYSLSHKVAICEPPGGAAVNSAVR